MKYLNHILLLLLFGAFVVSCERDTNGRMPDDIKEGGASVLILKEGSDPFINVDDKAGYKLNVATDLLFDAEFQKIDVVVVFNGNYNKEYLLRTITTVPTDFNFTSQDLVAAIDELQTVNDIAERQTFNIYTNITLEDGTFIPGYLSNGKATYSPSVINVMKVLKGAVPDIRITVPCPFVLADYLGVKDANEDWDGDIFDYPVEVVLDPADTNPDDVNIGVIIKGIFDPTWDLYVVLSKYDYKIRGPKQLMGAEVFGYKDPTWDKISGTIETCDKTLVVLINSFCVSVGCFGGLPIVYTITTPEIPEEGDGVKKSTGALKMFPDPRNSRPFRMVE